MPLFNAGFTLQPPARVPVFIQPKHILPHVSAFPKLSPALVTLTNYWQDAACVGTDSDLDVLNG